MPDRSPPQTWHGIGLVSFTAAGAASVIGTFLPWLRTGRRTRSSYELFELVDRLGFAPDGAVGVLLRAWPVVPLLVTVAVVLTWWRRLSFGLVASALAALYVGGVSLALVVGADDTPIDLGIGPLVCSIASVAFFANALVLQLTGRLRHEAPAVPPVPSPHADTR